MRIPKVRPLAVLCAMLAAAFAVSAAQAATYYVAANGNDDNPGLESAPVRTIAQGLQLLRAGDVLLIRQGLYREAINSKVVRIPGGFSWERPTRIAAYPGERVVLQPGEGNEVVNLEDGTISYVVFSSLALDASGVRYGVSLQNGVNRVRFEGCEIMNAALVNVITGNGTGSTTHNEFVRCRIHDSGTSHGMYIQTGSNLIAQCDIYNNGRYGVQIYTGYPGHRASNNVVRANRLWGNGRASYGFAIVVSAGDHNAVYNNLIWANQYGGIEVQWQSPSHAKVYHNTICLNTASAGIEIGSDSSYADVRNNIVTLNRVAITDRGVQSRVSNNFLGDPQFLDADRGDFGLRNTSPAIDAALPIDGFGIDDDLQGNPRPQGRAPDYGAIEFMGQAPLAPQAPKNLRITGKTKAGNQAH